MLVIRHLSNTGTNCIAPSGLLLLLCLFPGLAPWAFLSRPSGLVSRQKQVYRFTEMFTYLTIKVLSSVHYRPWVNFCNAEQDFDSSSRAQVCKPFNESKY